MVFVGGAILPHGTMIFDGDPNSASLACRKRNSLMPPDLIQNCSNLYRSCEHAGNLVAKMKPDIVLLITPHGLALSSGSYAVYLANGARGNALWNDCFQDIELSIRLDAQVSSQLLEFVQKRGFKADGIFTFSRMESPLRWGEVVPLWFVDKNVDSEKVKYVIVSFARNGDGFQAMGKALHDFVTTLEQRLAVVVSGDLAHTHATTCDIPLYLPDHRWDLKPTDIAEQFDWTCEMWARGVPYSEETRVGSVCIADKAQGVVPWNKRRREVKLTLDMNLSLELLKFVQERDVKADGIITFGASDAPLKWGEVVPLWFVDRKLDSAKTKYIIIGFCSGDMADAMGKTLHEFVSSLKQRVAVVISADLAHTHKTDSTIPDLYLPDPGWGIKPTEIADEFDRACEMWGRGIPYREDIQNGLDDVEETRPWIANDCLPWLQKATEQDEVAKSCGRVGFQVLHGVLEKEIEAGGNIKSHFLARGAPTYFGMMSVVFDIQGS